MGRKKSENIVSNDFDNRQRKFDPKKLTKEQQEMVVEEYLGVPPKYFLYEGLQIKLNFGRYEADNRAEAARTGKPRKCFNGWKPKDQRTW